MKIIKDLKNTQPLDIYYGFLHTLVAFTSVVFVSTISNFNIPVAFLTVGIGTIIFHIITDNKLASIMGVSGSYIGGMAVVSQQYGLEYVLGGVIVSAVIYVVFGLLMIKWQDRIMKLFPEYILNMAVLFIALTLIPIGTDIAKVDPAVAVASIIGVFIFDNIKQTKMFAMPLGVIAGFIVSVVKNGLISTSIETSIVITHPKFNVASFLTIGLVALAVVFETLGDIKNTGNAQGIDAFREVGVGKVLLGNGLSSLVSGSIGGLPLTTYSENVGFLYMTKYTRPNAQLFTAMFYIILAFIPNLINLIGYIPRPALGGILIYLFSLIAMNTFKEISIEGDKQGSITVAMIIGFFIAPFISSAISPIALAMIVGLVLNLVSMNRKGR